MMNYRKTFDTEDPFPDEESSWEERKASRKLVLYDDNGDRITLTCVEWDDGRQVPFYQLDCGEAYLTLADIEAIVYLAREKFGTLQGLGVQDHYGAVQQAADKLRDSTKQHLARESEDET